MEAWVLRDEQDYRGCRDTRFQLHPGRQSKGVQSGSGGGADETSRLFARTVAKIEPEWVETVARKLVKYTHGDPYWSKRQGQIMVHERGTLFGLPVVGKRAVGVAKRLPGKARELLIRDGLCQGEIKTQGPFLQNNLDQVAKVLDLEARERRRDLLTTIDCSNFTISACHKTSLMRGRLNVGGGGSSGITRNSCTWSRRMSCAATVTRSGRIPGSSVGVG